MAETKVAKKVNRNELEVFQKDVLTVWTNTDAIRKTFAPTLTDVEFKFFVGVGISLGANPFLKEIFAIKYGTNPAAIVVARDFYRKKAEQQTDYFGHYSEAVYPFEKFVPNPAKGIVEHVIDTVKRYTGDPVDPLGAYCIVMRKDKHPFYIWVPFREYVQTIKEGDKVRRRKFWANQGETMIKKVAESQGLRGAYQGIFAGTQSEEEVNIEQMNRELDSGEVIEDLTSKIVQRGQQNENKPEAKPPAKAKFEPEPESEPEPEDNKIMAEPIDENVFPPGHKWQGQNIEMVNELFANFLNNIYPKYVGPLYNKAKIKSPEELAKKFKANNLSPDEIGPETLEKIKTYLEELKGQKSLL